MSRPPLEVADVVRQHGDVFLQRYGHTLSGAQHRALRAIALCRTAALGGHITQCDDCGHEVQAYNSCRNRSCPKCHGAAQATWLAAREGEVLNTPYVHGIFTLPHDLGPLALQNPRLLYGLLFRTVAQTLQDIAGDPKHLGAEIGGFAVLHTWGQQLHHHPISTVSCLREAWPPTGPSGCRVDHTSSCPSVSSRAAFGDCTSQDWPTSMAKAT